HSVAGDCPSLPMPTHVPLVVGRTMPQKVEALNYFVRNAVQPTRSGEKIDKPAASRGCGVGTRDWVGGGGRDGLAIRLRQPGLPRLQNGSRRRGKAERLGGSRHGAPVAWRRSIKGRLNPGDDVAFIGTAPIG